MTRALVALVALVLMLSGCDSASPAQWARCDKVCRSVEASLTWADYYPFNGRLVCQCAFASSTAEVKP